MGDQDNRWPGFTRSRHENKGGHVNFLNLTWGAQPPSRQFGNQLDISLDARIDKDIHGLLWCCLHIKALGSRLSQLKNKAPV